MTAASLTAGGPQLLAHIGALGQHDMWVIIPMAVLSALIMVAMARPKRAPADDDEDRDRPDHTRTDASAPPDWR